MLATGKRTKYRVHLNNIVFQSEPDDSFQRRPGRIVSEVISKPMLLLNEDKIAGQHTLRQVPQS